MSRRITLTSIPTAGPLPDSWAAMRSLRSVVLSGNLLTGTLPSTWGDLLLQYLVLDNNQLMGWLPPAWGGMSYLRVLSLGMCCVVRCQHCLCVLPACGEGGGASRMYQNNALKPRIKTHASKQHISVILFAGACINTHTHTHVWLQDYNTNTPRLMYSKQRLVGPCSLLLVAALSTVWIDIVWQLQAVWTTAQIPTGVCANVYVHTYVQIRVMMVAMHMVSHTSTHVYSLNTCPINSTASRRGAIGHPVQHPHRGAVRHRQL